MVWTSTTETAFTANFQGASVRRHSWPAEWRDRQYPVLVEIAVTAPAAIAETSPNEPGPERGMSGHSQVNTRPRTAPRMPAVAAAPRPSLTTRRLGAVVSTGA